MRRSFVVLVVLLVLTAASVTTAGIEAGLGVLVSWGTGTQEWTSRMVLHEEGTGRDLVPENGIVMPAPDRAILGQIIFAKDMNFGPEAFRFYWATVATPRDGDWTLAQYNPKFGYIFRIDPMEYGNGDSLDTPLQLQVWIKNGKKPFVRIILKFTFPKSAVAREALWIRPTQPQQQVAATAPSTIVADAAKIDDNFSKLSAAIDLLGKNQQAIADNVNASGAATADLVARIDRLEQWADAAVAQSQQPAQQTPVVTTLAKFGWKLVLPPGKWQIIASCGGNMRTFTGPFCGTVEFRDATAGEVRLRLTSGQTSTTWRSVMLTGPCTVKFNELEVR